MMEHQPPAATFASLPLEHQREMRRMMLAAALSVVLVVAVAILTRPIPSRNMGAYVLLPSAAAARNPVLEATLTATPAIAVAPVSARRARLTPRREAVSVVAASDAADDDLPAPSAVPAGPHHRNIFSRFFRTVLRGVQTGPVKTVDP